MEEVEGFGGVRINVIGGFSTLPAERLSSSSKRILAYLAIKCRTVSRAHMAAEMWPELPDEAGRANLRRALWHVPRSWIQACNDDVALDAATDLSAANLAVNRALSGGALSIEEIRLLSEDILPGWHEDWTIGVQDSFRLLRVQALEAACRTMVASGMSTIASQAGAAALAAEPLCESAAEALIDAFLAQHNRFLAVRCFRELEKRLGSELGVAPDPKLRARLADLAL
ncbi:DNA-binding SARP family transcriptional activator [Novosphingobium sp. PhB57]|uniref:AfsR/SARP family transcriptional regulator n=1 Tax=unclassified Novosphingobium TaxID=2644732 RepID=UPI0010473A92|nr:MULTISPECIES: BTAD domain-containing putative transcriptional regulator [unclassified Novosphingobium]TCU57806.1 DNA-binding SARP family transcriptional activator [Novosphingobium sp. PhB57]TDW64602.1 DNA-binding SARP family transcriptional activator [Novosphingobium sp. PhB55]